MVELPLHKGLKHVETVPNQISIDIILTQVFDSLSCRHYTYKHIGVQIVPLEAISALFLKRQSDNMRICLELSTTWCIMVHIQYTSSTLEGCDM